MPKPAVLKAESDQNAQPLDVLAAHLHGDMNAVNDMILNHMQSDVPLIPQLASYLIAAGGKRVRPLLTLACTALYDGDMTRAHGLAASVEFIHTATLLHDDVVDGSEERRGQDAANLVFGNQASVLVGDFLFSRAFQLMVQDGSLDVLRILSNASAVIAEGEVLQLSLAGNTGITMEQYTEVITAKTAALFAAACEVGPIIAGADKKQTQAMHDYGLNLGIAFQIADDALDYDADREKLGKTIGDDFREGKLTASVILALQEANDEEKQFWNRVMSGENKNENQNDEDLEQAQALLAKHDTITASLALANAYKDKAIQSLSAAPDHSLHDTLASLAEYVIKRQS